jgi:DNA polymerase IV
MFSPSPLKWLYVDFNSYFASVEQQLNPALRGKPVAVVPVDKTDSTCAIAASYEAKAFGVKTGTPIWQARQLCPDIICVLARHDEYVEFHHRAIDEVNRHIPVTDVCSIDEVACRLMRNEAPPDDARRIALSIKAGLAASLGPWVRCSIGVASNRYLAKVATDLQKPDGLTILIPQEVEARLITLKPIDLPGIGRNMERRLRRQGIYSMRDIWALERVKMRHVWGSIWGERMWYLLRGYDLEEPETKRRSIGHSHVLAPALRPADQAINVGRRLTLKAAARLRRMGYCATVFGISARLEDGRRIGIEQKVRPSQDSITFLRILVDFWQEAIPKGRDIRVKKMSVVMYGLIAEDAVQPDLFDPLSFGDIPPAQRDIMRTLRLSQALDKINNRFGRDSALIGMTPAMGRGFSGTKIAFTRIPDREEFRE